MSNNGWKNQVIQHNVLERFPLPDSCIDVVMTSPPYWGLRDYGVDGQIGLEEHPKEYIGHLVQVAGEVRRVLKKSGSFYLNLGDTYCGSGMGTWDVPDDYKSKQVYFMDKGKAVSAKVKNDGKWLQPKQLMLIPVRVACALQDDGWILRNDIIWHKPNPMPSSVKDRLNNTFEHVFHFVKSRRYYYDLDSIREPHKTVDVRGYNRVSYDIKSLNQDHSPSSNAGYLGQTPKGKNPGDVFRNKSFDNKMGMWQAPEPNEPCTFHEKGKNPGDFWDICTQPFTSYCDDMEHFAVFPEELVEKPLRASCPSDGVVLDPFGGRGTVGRVAKRLGLDFVVFDLNPKYCELARLFIHGQKRKLIKNQGELYDSNPKRKDT